MRILAGMKNKHLVLLFILTLFIGLAVRRAPWRNAIFFQTRLIKLDPTEIQQIQITLPAQPTLFLLRGDVGWSAEQGERSVSISKEAVQKMLAAFADMRSIRIVKTARADSLGFSPASNILLTLIDNKDQQESLNLGWETIENKEPATYVQLPRHEGIYLVHDHLRNIFSKSLTDFRNQTIASFVPSNVRQFTVMGKMIDSLQYQKSDTAAIWVSVNSAQVLPDPIVQNWLKSLAGLSNLPFADLFDESHARDLLYTQIRLDIQDQSDPLILKFYHLNQINVPEILPVNKPDRRQLVPYILYSSQNSTNYFTFPDTALLYQICNPF